MAHRNDLEYEWLGAAGYTGALPDRRYAFFQAEGISTWREYYNQNGGTGHISDWLYQLFGGSAPPTPSTPAWEASTADPTTYEMLAQRIGEGTPTFTHTGLLLPDYEGVYRDIPANTAPWHGARIVRNEVLYNTTLTFWSQGSVTVVTGKADPAGGTDAVEVTGNAGNAPCYYTVNGAAIDDVVCNSLWVRRVSGTGSITLYSGVSAGSSINITADVTSEWKRFSPGPVTKTAATWRCGITLGTPGDVVEIYGAQGEYVNGASNQNPGETVLTAADPVVAAYANRNGNTVTDNVVTEAVGAPLPELPSLYAAPAATNLLTQSRDLTQAPWSNAVTVTYDQVGIAGEPNTASFLEDTGATLEFRRYNVTTSSGGAYTRRVFVKKDNDTSRFPEFPFVKSGEAEDYVQLNTQTGDITTRLQTNAQSVVDDGGDWWILYTELTTTTAGSLRADIQPAATTTWGASEATATGSIVVGNVEVYEASLAQIRGASAIITEGATGSTSAVDIDYDFLNHDNAQGAYYAEYAAMDEWTGQAGIVSTATRSEPMYQTLTQLATYSAGTNILALNDAISRDGSFDKVAVAYDEASGGNFRLTSNGNSSADTAGYNGFRTTIGTISPLMPALAGGGTQLIRNIQRWDLAYDDAKTKVDELMSTPSWPPALPAPEVDPTLVWAAVSDSYTYSDNGGGDYEMKAQGIGSGSPTFTHTGLLLPDYQGVYREIPANTAPWHGARIVRNDCDSSDDLTYQATGWGWVIVTSTTRTFAAGQGPNGEDATRLEMPDGAFNGVGATANWNGDIGDDMVLSVWVKSNTAGDQTFRLRAGNVNSPVLTATQEWQRFTHFDEGITGAGVAIYSGNDGSACDILVSGFQKETRNNDTNKDVPLETVRTVAGSDSFGVGAFNSTKPNNTVSNNVVQENIGVPLDSLPSLYAAPAATNLITYSQDLTDASWSTGFGVTAAYDETGLTGEPNTASTVTHPGGNSRTWRHDIILPTASTTYTLKVYMKKGVGTDWGALQVESFTGLSDTKAYFDLSSGALGAVGTGLDSTAIEDVGNGWYACYVEFTIGTDAIGRLNIYCANADDTITCTNGDTTIVGNAECYEATIAQIRGASPIITAGSTASTSVVELDYPVANHDESRGAYYAEFNAVGTPSAGSPNAISFGSASYSPLKWQTRASWRAQAVGAVATTTQILIGNYGGAFYKVGSAYDADGSGDLGVRHEDTVWAEDTGYTSFNTPSVLQVANNGNGTAAVVYLIRNIRRYDLSYTAAKAKIDELMS